MPLRIKVDEDLPHAIAEAFRAAGHDAMTVPEQKLAGFQDEHLFAVVQAEARILFTADVAFADARRYPPGSHYGIILFRPATESRETYRQLALQLLAWQRLPEIQSAITVVTDTRIRIRLSAKLL